MLFDPNTEDSLRQRVAKEVPDEKKAGAVVFYDQDTGQMELYMPSEDQFYTLGTLELTDQTGTAGDGTVSGVQTGTISSSITSALAALGITISNGVTNIATLTSQQFSADNAQINTANIGQIQMADRTTGKQYCIWFDNGQMVEANSDCVSASTSSESSLNIVSGTFSRGGTSTSGSGSSGNSGGSSGSGSGSGTTSGGGSSSASAQAASFSGNGSINLGSGSSLQGYVASGVFTYNAWVNIPSTLGLNRASAILGGASNGFPYLKIAYGNGQSQDQCGSNYHLEFDRQGQVNIAKSSMSNCISPNTWTMVTVTYDSSGNYAFYINGIAAGSGTNKQSFIWSNPTIGSGYPTENAIGPIDELQIYNTALSASQVTSLYNGGSGYYGAPSSFTSNLVSDYHLDGDFTDAVGRNNGTQTGGVTFVPGFINSPLSFGHGASQNSILLGLVNATGDFIKSVLSAGVKLVFSLPFLNNFTAGLSHQ